MFRRLTSALSGACLLVATFGAPASAASLTAETIAARQRYFGLDNVDPRTGAVRGDRAIVSWLGVSNFAASFKGHVVLLGAYIARGGGGRNPVWPGMAYTGSTPEELAALKPELVLIGHTHYDHTGDLPQVVRANPGLLVAGTAEQCGNLKKEVTDVAFTCEVVFAAGAELGTSKVFEKLLPGVSMTAVRHPHSWPPANPESSDKPFPFARGPEACHAHVEYPGAGDPPAWRGGTTDEGLIAIAWQIRIGDFALMWQDTAGTIEGTPVPAAFARLAPTDVRIAAIAVSPRSVLNQQTMALKPKLFLPVHHDPCAPSIRQEVENQLATVPAAVRPAMWYMADPSDYLRPISFDPAAQIWKNK